MSEGEGADLDPSDESRIDRLEERVDRLERAIRVLTERVGDEDEAVPEDEPAQAPASEREPSTAEERAFEPATPGSAPGARVQGPSASDPEATPTSLEERIGADLLAKVGVTVLVLGLAFFVAWAIESGLIGLRTRVVLGVLGGLGVAAGAYPFRNSERYGRLARVFAGGGFGLAYFSLFAAHHFPEYQQAIGIGFWTDTVLLTVVAAGVAAYGLRIESPAFLLEALTLGVTTAFLAHEFTAFTLAYATAIGIGVAFAAARLQAPRVMTLSLATIYGHGVVIHLAGESPELVLGALAVDGAIVAGFALWVPTETTPRVRADASDRVFLYGANAAALVATGAFVAETGGVLDEGVFALLAGVALLLAALPAGTRSGDLAAASLLSGLASLLLGAWLALTPVQVVYAWAGAYTVLAVLVPVLDRSLLDGTVHAVGVLLGLGAFNALPELDPGGERTAVLGLVALAFAIGFVAFKRGRDRHPAAEVYPPAAAHLAAATVALGMLLLAELEAWRATVALGAAGIAPLLAGFLADWPEPRWAGLSLFGLALGKAFLVDVWSLDPGLRVVAFVGLGLALVAGAFAYARFLKPGDPETRGG